MSRQPWNPRWGWAALAAIVMTPVAASAQVGPRPVPERGVIEQRVRARFGEMVRQELGLDGDQLARVEAVVRSFEEERRGLVAREGKLRRRLRGGAEPDLPTDPEAIGILREMVALREDEGRLFRGEMDELRKILSPAQTVRFYEMRAELMDRIQRLRQPGRPGPGGPLGRSPDSDRPTP